MYSYPETQSEELMTYFVIVFKSSNLVIDEQWSVRISVLQVRPNGPKTHKLFRFYFHNRTDPRIDPRDPLLDESSRKSNNCLRWRNFDILTPETKEQTTLDLGEMRRVSVCVKNRIPENVEVSVVPVHFTGVWSLQVEDEEDGRSFFFTRRELPESINSNGSIRNKKVFYIVSTFPRKVQGRGEFILP